VFEGESTADSDLCAPALFVLQAERTPAAVAMVNREAAISYVELGARSSVLSARSRDLGVKRDVLVGLCVEQSIAFVVGLMGRRRGRRCTLPSKMASRKAA
jgi:non-ribosomal peptide synthetase component F